MKKIDEKKFEHGYEEINGRKVPYTRDGKLNKKHLTKVEREIVDEYVSENEKEEKEKLKQAIRDALKAKSKR
jgi:hypothetical protein